MTARLRERVKTRRREKELASSERAGRWSRRRAREIQREFMRAHWRLIVGIIGFLAAVVGAGAVVLDGPPVWFAFGFVLAGTIGILWHWVVLFSGSAGQVMGDMGEQWTQQALKPLRRRGWKVVHSLAFHADRDIDSVAIGPAGIVVIETKWSSHRWKSPLDEETVTRAIARLRRASRTVQLVLRDLDGEVPTHSVLVLWPSLSEVPFASSDNVSVVSGDRLGPWIEARDPAGISAERVTRAWRVLEQHIAKRDEADLRESGPPPPSAEDYIRMIAEPAAGFVAGTLVVASAGRLGIVPALVTAGGAPLAAGWLRRFKLVRRGAVGAFLASCTYSAFVVGAIFYVYLIR